MYTDFRDKLNDIEKKIGDANHRELQDLREHIVKALELVKDKEVCPDCGSCELSKIEDDVKCKNCDLEF